MNSVRLKIRITRRWYARGYVGAALMLICTYWLRMPVKWFFRMDVV